MFSFSSRFQPFISLFNRYSSSNSLSCDIKILLPGFQTIVDRPVDWGTMDAFQHVNNVQFVRWFEVVRVQHMQDLANFSGQMGFLSSSGIGPILKDAYIKYKGQVTYPDTVSIAVKTTSIDETSYTEEYKIISHKTKRIVCEGNSTIVTLDYKEGKRAPIPPNFKSILNKDLSGINWKTKE